MRMCMHTQMRVYLQSDSIVPGQIRMKLEKIVLFSFEVISCDWNTLLISV